MGVTWDTLVEAEAAPAAFRPGELATKFLQPPFTVLDTRKGDWIERRRAWLSLGIRSELGRGVALVSQGGLAAAEGARSTYEMAANPTDVVAGAGGMTAQMARRWQGALPVSGSAGEWSKEHTAAAEGGTSIFDPVLCELAYRWWAPEGGRVLDPFAGGSVRGIVAAKLGHPYTGIDLSREQLAANREQAAAILGPGEPVPNWVHGDSTQLEALLPAGDEYDLVWTCPPYFDLEIYSNDPADLSGMDWPGFIDAYQRVIHAAAARLRPGRFAGIVVSEVRDPTGAYRGLVPLTIHAFALAGLRFYNEAILVNSAGSLPLRVTKYMEASRKLGRAHQNVLVFLKGEAPRGWSYDRAAPPSPQLDLALLPEPDPEPVPAVPVAPQATEPADAPSGASGLDEAERPNLEGTPLLDALGAPTDEIIDSLVEGDDDEAVLEGEWHRLAEEAEMHREAVAAGDTIDHPDGYVADATTGEVLEYPGVAAITYRPPAPSVAEPELESPTPTNGGASVTGLPTSCNRSDHPAGTHASALEAGACRADCWYPGWPSVVPAGPPGSGATASPGEQRPTTLWQPSDDSDEEGTPDG